MSTELTATELLNREFLEMRHGLINIAAAFDRVDRADGAVVVRTDPRMGKLREAVMILTDGESNRAQRMQLVFSDEYDPAWREADA